MSDHYLSLLEVRRLLGARPDYHDTQEPCGTNAGGWYEYDDIMCCHDCPLMFITSKGALQTSCAEDGAYVFEWQPCRLGVRKDGRGLIQDDFNRLDEAIARINTPTSLSLTPLRARKNPYCEHADKMREQAADVKPFASRVSDVEPYIDKNNER